VTVADAVELIRPAVTPTRGATWVDFGAGRGLFTAALAALLGEGGIVIAVDRDASAVRELHRLAQRADGADIRVVAGDVLHLERIPELTATSLDGALFANVLHYVAEPERVLACVRNYLSPVARIIVIEYDRRSASRWVPHPLSSRALTSVARAAGLSAPLEVGRRPSRYQGELYCAVLHNRPGI
jgi:SAM-dependent methyltransferase